MALRESLSICLLTPPFSLCTEEASHKQQRWSSPAPSRRADHHHTALTVPPITALSEEDEWRYAAEGLASTLIFLRSVRETHLFLTSEWKQAIGIVLHTVRINYFRSDQSAKAAKTAEMMQLQIILPHGCTSVETREMSEAKFMSGLWWGWRCCCGEWTCLTGSQCCSHVPIKMLPAPFWNRMKTCNLYQKKNEKQNKTGEPRSPKQSLN